MITLDKHNLKYSTSHSEKPILKVRMAQFITKEKAWHKRLCAAQLSYIITGFDKNGEVLISSKTDGVLGEFINNVQQEPVVRINKEFSVRRYIGADLKKIPCNKWTASIELSDIDLLEGEHLEIDMEILKFSKANKEVQVSCAAF